MRTFICHIYRLLRLKRRYRDVMNTLVVLLPQLLRCVCRSKVYLLFVSVIPPYGFCSTDYAYVIPLAHSSALTFPLMQSLSPVSAHSSCILPPFISAVLVCSCASFSTRMLLLVWRSLMAQCTRVAATGEGTWSQRVLIGMCIYVCVCPCMYMCGRHNMLLSLSCVCS